MKRQGFKYVTAKQTVGVPIDSLDRNGAFSQKEFIKRYGFGISTLPDRRLFSKDPNDAIREALESGEKQQYLQALVGAKPGERMSPTSCRGQLTAVTQNTKIAALQKSLDNELAKLEQSEAVLNLYDGWSDCFRDKTGLIFGNPESVVTFVSDTSSDPVTVQSELAIEEVRLAKASFECQDSTLKPFADLRQSTIDAFLSGNKDSIEHLSLPGSSQ